jgi:hypothetical protein
MFLSALLSSLLFAQISVPALPATTPDPAYPIHVQLAQSGATGDVYGMTYFGRGNILGTSLTGFDYSSDCYRQTGSMQNHDPSQYFQARWKKQDLRLEILLQEIGNKHPTRCELKVTPHPGPYNLTTQIIRPATTSTPSIAATVPNANYPLHVQLQVTRSSSNPSYGSDMEGRGNILGSPDTGFDFVSTCDQRLFINVSPNRDSNEFYQARWKEKDLKLEILLQEIGSKQPSPCELKVTVRQTPYTLANQASRPATMPPLSVAATVPNADYPLHVQLQLSRSSFSPANGADMEGRGNILGPPDIGFDFVSNCDYRLPMNGSMNRDPSEFYQARWKEKDTNLEILLQQVGSKDVSSCLMNVTVRPQPYTLFPIRPVPTALPSVTTAPSPPRQPAPQ